MKVESMSDITPAAENIVLTGFMGSGKSTVGRLLARQLRFQFLDTDSLIEERVGMEIRDIFAKYGEPYFRDRENAMLESLLHKKRHVISTGGGIVTQERNLKSLRQLGWVVLLKADPEKIFERVSRNKKRPLLSTPDPHASVIELLEKRQPLYDAAAQFTVDSTSLEVDAVVNVIATEARKIFGWKQPPARN